MRAKRKSRLTKQRGVEARREVEALTVAWIVCTGWSVAAQIVTAIAYVCSIVLGTHRAVAVYAGWMLAAAALLGLTAIVMTPVVLRRRRTRPPQSVVMGSLVVNALPLVILAVLFVARQ